jgi:exodeoxyribonuclease V alpha subunit
MGYEKNDPRRCKSGLSYTLSQLADEGHVYAEETQLIQAANALLAADETSLRHALTAMIQAEELFLDDEAILSAAFLLRRSWYGQQIACLA